MSEFEKLFNNIKTQETEKTEKLKTIKSIINSIENLNNDLNSLNNKKQNRRQAIYNLCSKLNISFPYEDDFENLKKLNHTRFKTFIYKKNLENLNLLVDELKEIDIEITGVKKRKQEFEEALNLNTKINIQNYPIELKDNVLIVSDLEIDNQENVEFSSNNKYLVYDTDVFPENKLILSDNKIRKNNHFQYQVSEKCYVIKDYMSNCHNIKFMINNTSSDDANYLIIEPVSYHLNELNNNCKSDYIRLSDEAILMVKDELYNSLTEEQKLSYKIVLYKGSLKKCLRNFLCGINSKMIEEDIKSDNTIDEALEKNLNYRDIYVNLVNGNKAASNFQTISFYDFALLYKYLHKGNIKIMDKYLQKLSEQCNIDKNLANFIMNYGFVRTQSGRFRMLPYEEIKFYIENPKYYIDEFSRVGIGFSDIKDLINVITLKNYQIDNTTVDDFDNIAVGKLQKISNFESLNNLVEVLNLSYDEVLVLMEDGLYITYKNEKNDYTNVENKILIGGNLDTIYDIISNYIDSVRNKKVR